MKRFLILVVCLLVILGFYGINAMQCYLCNSHNDSRCADEHPPDALKKDCSDLKNGSKYTMCRKITQVIEFSVNGQNCNTWSRTGVISTIPVMMYSTGSIPPDTRVIRGCGWDESSYKGRCYQRSGFGGRQEVCSCLTDFCNTATPNVLPPTSLILSCIIGSVLLAYIRN